MTPYYEDDLLTVYHGDCLDVLASMSDCSVDAVVTDPPYGLGFMGKAWDSSFVAADVPMRRSGALDAVNTGAARQGGRQRAGQDYQRRMARDSREFGAWCERWAAECLRVLKPGGHLLTFGGTRTWHRLACAIEDAGFEVRDSIAWLYGSGFPKSLDVSKAIDKAARAEREVLGVAGRSGGGRIAMDAGNRSGYLAGDYYETAPATPEAERWQGWGTALKPAFEPIVVARKPLTGTVAQNVLQHGTGALNIDACRIHTAGSEGVAYTVKRLKPGATLQKTGGTWRPDDNTDLPWEAGREYEGQTKDGRWPTNVVLDDTQAAELDKQSGMTASREGKPRAGANGDGWGMTATGAEYSDTGGASRFFPTFRYEAKAPTKERPRVDGVAHPTVKPLDLMRWLVRLVTPPGGTVLEPFAGSGTTAEACVIEGFRCIAIEREATYLPLIVARLSKPIQPVMFGEPA